MKTTANPRKALWRSILAMMLVVSMLAAASVTCFAETTASEEATEETAVTGITTVSVSLSEDIIVKFYTSATTGDGSKLTVAYNGETYELTDNIDGLFEFVGVTPQTWATK